MSKHIITVFNHRKRQEALGAARTVCEILEKADIAAVGHGSDAQVELIIVLSGNGTVLETAYIAQSQQVPLMRVNLGHVGSLAEAGEENLEDLCRRVINGDYQTERRMYIDAEIRTLDGKINTKWAVNDIVVLSIDSGRPALLAFGVDGGAVSEYGADGLVVSTPTGSTAYNFSVGGPVIWPDVQALVLPPLAAHGLFTRSLVLRSTAVLEIQVLPNQVQDCEVWADGNRVLQAPPGISIRVVKSVSNM